MNSISFVIVICAAAMTVRGSLEQIKEQAWMDKQAQDKYFEYSGELLVPVGLAENSVEVVETVQKQDKVRVHQSALLWVVQGIFFSI